MKYKLLREEFADSLQDSVNNALNEGWELYGYPTISHNEDSVTKQNYIQAMIDKGEQ